MRWGPAADELTRRELDVLRLAAGGMNHRQIAFTLGIEAKTARNHLANLYAKLGIHSRTEAVLYAVRHGLVEWPGVSPPG